MNWLQGMQEAILYIEDNLTEKLDYAEIAKRTYVSSFHFQRAFAMLCGFTLGEYIRNRRLSLAGMELAAGGAAVIDIALKYGYDSPDSFAKAFSRFHGVSPSTAKKATANLKSFAPLKIKFNLEGGKIMEYRIENKEAFKIIGTVKEFNNDTSYSEIPKFWSEHYESGDGKHIMGTFGICYGSDGNSGNFSYMIADFYKGGEFPDKFAVKELPAKTYAVFPCKGALPKSLQSVNTQIWTEWLPNCREYELDGDFNIEMYTPCDTNSDGYYSEIWLPVRKV